MKTNNDRKIFLEQLKKTPIIQAVCEKTNISRPTYYRWRKTSKTFRDLSDKALLEGTQLINDLAEFTLIGLIKNKNVTSVIYWLKNHHPTYSEKLHLIKEEKYEELKPEQAKALAKAIRIAQDKYMEAGIPEKTNGSDINKERDPMDWNHF